MLNWIFHAIGVLVVILVITIPWAIGVGYIAARIHDMLLKN